MTPVCRCPGKSTHQKFFRRDINHSNRLIIKTSSFQQFAPCGTTISDQQSIGGFIENLTLSDVQVHGEVNTGFFSNHEVGTLDIVRSTFKVIEDEAFGGLQIRNRFIFTENSVTLVKSRAFSISKAVRLDGAPMCVAIEIVGNDFHKFLVDSFDVFRGTAEGHKRANLLVEFQDNKVRVDCSCSFLDSIRRQPHGFLRPGMTKFQCEDARAKPNLSYQVLSPHSQWCSDACNSYDPWRAKWCTISQESMVCSLHIADETKVGLG
jgi:hypothetical protein